MHFEKIRIGITNSSEKRWADYKFAYKNSASENEEERKIEGIHVQIDGRIWRKTKFPTLCSKSPVQSIYFCFDFTFLTKSRWFTVQCWKQNQNNNKNPLNSACRCWLSQRDSDKQIRNCGNVHRSAKNPIKLTQFSLKKREKPAADERKTQKCTSWFMAFWNKISANIYKSLTQPEICLTRLLLTHIGFKFRLYGKFEQSRSKSGTFHKLKFVDA